LADLVNIESKVFTIRDLRLEGGQTLPLAELAYETYGALTSAGDISSTRHSKERTTMTSSITLSAANVPGKVAAAFSANLGWFVFFRCTTFVGVCVEFVAAVAWLAELFPDPVDRERVLGYTQACASLGGLMVSAAYYWIVTFAASLPEVRGGHEPWRYMLISGIVPAIPLLLARPFLPESPMWIEKRNAGTLRRPSVAELFRPRVRRTTIVATVMVACGYAASFGANLQVPRIVPGLSEVQAMSRTAREQTVGTVQLLQEFGGLAGMFEPGWLPID